MASFRVSTLAGASSSLDTMGTGERAGAMAVTLAAMCGAVLLDQTRADVCGKPSSDSWEGECSKSAVRRCAPRACVAHETQPQLSSVAW